MYCDFLPDNYKDLDFINKYVNAIIPCTPALAQKFGEIQLFGALDLRINEYVICSLNHSFSREIDRLEMFGYYSEWSGYGFTRLGSPNKRKLEQYPISWKQVKYLGPSEGYHAFRGYLINKFIE